MTNEEARNLENEIAEEELAEYRSLMEAAAASEDTEFRSDREMAIAYEINRLSNAYYTAIVRASTWTRLPLTLEEIDLFARAVAADRF